MKRCYTITFWIPICIVTVRVRGTTVHSWAEFGSSIIGWWWFTDVFFFYPFHIYFVIFRAIYTWEASSCIVYPSLGPLGSGTTVLYFPVGRTDSNRDSLLPISRGLHQRKNKISLVKFKFTPIQKTTRVQISRGLHQIKKDWSEPHQTTQEFKVFTGLREREEDWSEPNSNLKIPKTEEGTDSISPQVCRLVWTTFRSKFL